MARALKPTTVFVHNLPERMHWKGLWASFGHHGDVLDAFIPNKRSRSGKRFGFVRFSSKIDAQRAISRLNGFALFGSRLSVSMAKFRPRMSYWRKVEQGENKGNQNPSLSQSFQKLSRKKEECTQRNFSRVKVKGYIDIEALWKLQNYLIGFTNAESDSARLMDRLCTWGLGEIKVK
ncbi:hypothetical protein V6N13_123430 [Hibiscus sabdariffa]